MTFQRNAIRALLAATALALPAAAMAQSSVDKQANKVAAEAQDLQQAAAKLDNSVANTTGDGYAATDNDRDGDHDRGKRHDDDDDSGKWGLLGLLGLAGLLGLKRRDHDHHHVEHRDVDRDFDRTTTTGTTTTGTRTDQL